MAETLHTYATEHLVAVGILNPEQVFFFFLLGFGAIVLIVLLHGLFRSSKKNECDSTPSRVEGDV